MVRPKKSAPEPGEPYVPSKREKAAQVEFMARQEARSYPLHHRPPFRADADAGEHC